MTKEVQKAAESGSGAGKTRPVRVLRPAVDIQELADSYVVRLDVPGADKETIAAQIDQSTLRVSAKAAGYFRPGATLLVDTILPVEYRREFSLADNINPQSVDARYDLGVLKITLQKKRQFLPREIKIS